MTTIRNITALALAAAALAPAAAQALPPAPPTKDGVTCQQAVKRTYSLSQVLRHGLPVNVTCDGPAHFLVEVNFPAMTQQSRDLTVLLGHKDMPTIAFSHDVNLAKAGTATQRPRLVPLARKVVKRYPKTKLNVLFSVERDDGYLWSEPKLNKLAVLVR